MHSEHYQSLWLRKGLVPLSSLCHRALPRDLEVDGIREYAGLLLRFLLMAASRLKIKRRKSYDSHAVSPHLRPAK